MFPLKDDNPTSITPWLTWSIILLCVLIFLWQLSLGTANHQAVFAFGMIPAVLFQNAQLSEGLDVIPSWATVFTSMFLHGGWMHIIGNMIYLWIFGDNVEAVMGRARFLVFYLACGAAAAMAQALPDTTSQTPMIGASGAIAGVLGAYLLLFPRAKVIVWFPLGFIMLTQRVPAGLVLGFYFVVQLYSTLTMDMSGGGVAFAAHLGGFIAGMMLIPFFKHKHVRLFAPARD